MKTYDEVNGELVEIDPGSGGTFEIREGKRIRTSKPAESHPDGDRARNADGEPVDQAPTETAPALTPPGRAPWDPAPDNKKGD